MPTNEQEVIIKKYDDCGQLKMAMKIRVSLWGIV